MTWLKRIGLGIVGLMVLSFLVLFIWSGGASGKAVNKASITVTKPAAEVFPWLVQPEKLKQWVEGLVDSVPLNGDSLRIGTRSKEIVNANGERFEMDMEITELEINRLLGFTLSSSMLDQDGEYRVSEKNGLTTVQFTGNTQYKGFFLCLVEPLFTPVAQKQYEKNMSKLKRLVEAE